MQAQRAPMRTPMRTAGQNNAIWGLVSQLDALLRLDARLAPAYLAGDAAQPLAQRWLRAIIQQVSGQESSARLTLQQAVQVIQQLEQALVQCKAALTGPQEVKPRAESTINPKQQEYILKLLKAIAGVQGRYSELGRDMTRQREWCTHWLKVPWPQTQADADVCVEALKSILLRELPASSVLQRELEQLGTTEGLNTFESSLVADGLKRSKRWGPYQWYLLHITFQRKMGGQP